MKGTNPLSTETKPKPSETSCDPLTHSEAHWMQRIKSSVISPQQLTTHELALIRRLVNRQLIHNRKDNTFELTETGQRAYSRWCREQDNQPDVPDPKPETNAVTEALLEAGAEQHCVEIGKQPGADFERACVESVERLTDYRVIKADRIDLGDMLADAVCGLVSAGLQDVAATGALADKAWSLNLQIYDVTEEDTQDVDRQ